MCLKSKNDYRGLENDFKEKEGIIVGTKQSLEDKFKEIVCSNKIEKELKDSIISADKYRIGLTNLCLDEESIILYPYTKGIMNIDITKLRTYIPHELMLQENGYKEIITSDSVYAISKVKNSLLAEDLIKLIYAYMNGLIIELLPTVKYTLDSADLYKITQKIADLSQIDIRNHSYINYDNGAALKIPYIYIPFLHNYGYFKSSDLKFDIKEISCNLKEWEDQKLDKYSEEYRVANGLYNIDGYYVTKSEAMRRIHEENFLIYFTFYFKTIVNSKSGFLIKLI